MFKNYIQLLSNYIKTKVSEDILNNIQRKLIDADLYIESENFIAVTLILIILVYLISIVICLLENFPIFYSFITIFLIPSIIIIYIYYKNEKRIENIELELPDYLRQLSALIKVGLGLESSFNELSTLINSPLNNEIKRALLETSFGKPFDEALIDIANRNNSENLKQVFQIMIYSMQTGGNLSEILDVMADDLSDTIMLKKERKAGVMMSVMFLILSSIIATPFALGMARLYSEFIGHVGRSNPLETVMPIASMGYIIIQAILVSILMGIVLYSDTKKGIKFIIFMVPSSLIVYYISQMIFQGILGV